MPSKNKLNKAELTKDSVLKVIQDPTNKKRKRWTSRIVLDRMGVYRWFEPFVNYQRQFRIRAKRILKELWIEGILVKKIKPDTRSLFGAEDTYMRVEDSPSQFYMACEKCHGDILATKIGRNIHKAPCQKCM